MKASCKEIALNEIMNCIDKITICQNKNITVKWAIAQYLLASAELPYLCIIQKKYTFYSYRNVEKTPQIIYHIRDI